MLASFVNTPITYSLHGEVHSRIASREELLKYCNDTNREYDVCVYNTKYEKLCDRLKIKVDIGSEYYLNGIASFINSIKEEYKLPRNFYLHISYDARFLTIVDHSYEKVREKEILDAFLGLNKIVI